MGTTAVHSLVRSQPGFLDTVPDGNRDDLFEAYLGFLKDRNGELRADGRFTHRETWLEQAAQSPISHRRPMDQGEFEASYARFDAKRELSLEHLALLAFVKLNSVEAYGVEVGGKARKRFHQDPRLMYRVEKVLNHEENYHTRILLGAAQHFGVTAQGAWRPPFALRVFIGAIVHAPQSLFHTLVIGGEIAGVYMFSWMLRRVGEIYKDEPELRDAMEARLIEILIDEVGHVAYNRLIVGPMGLSLGHKLARLLVGTSTKFVPEMGPLGIKESIRDEFAHFDYASLPEEVRRRSFYC
jgi:hypothetical protein